MTVEAVVRVELAQIAACESRDHLLIKMRLLAVQAEGLVSASPLRSAWVAFNEDHVEELASGLEGVVLLLRAAAKRRSELP